ncbi:hypothetical protein BV97_04912 [Novosphingobium resinovorum]|uniref:Uncharacterized protein n=1 Tax=Novosphingobium resinovorum TaxID=158500 RepID=A0A031JM59_9SPHN|nr:hypothetical protein [Novosphingobium resinovorum]EZP73805.1 hypothetical protein BV97_04912 [Novosphingobium resinovorum]
MGQAKAKRKARAERESLSKRISRSRFNLLAIGTRMSPAPYLYEEVDYWADVDELVIGVIARDVTDDDYYWALLARDRNGRFRSADMDSSLRSAEYATVALRERIAKAVSGEDLAALGTQGDETNHPTDLLTVPSGTKEKDLHPNFKLLLDTSGRAPARAVFKELGPWLAPSDPHFVKEFQTKQFDQRLWELYLWAVFRELGYDVTQPEAPDFHIASPRGEFTIEATTCAPSEDGVLADHPDPQTPGEMKVFLSDYMPMKFGGSLTTKLKKKNANGESYWERGPGAGKPFAIAIADFHKPGGDGEVGSMTWTQEALWLYLYGHRIEWEFVDGSLSIRTVKIGNHVYKTKTIETGFFDLEGAENISAVVFSNAGTLAKFDRMGVDAGYAPDDHRYLRIGFRLDPDPNAVMGTPFTEEVVADYGERWSDELQVFHNPRAKFQLPLEAFQGATQHTFEDGQLVSYSVGTPVLSSQTMIMRLVGDDEFKEATV